ncbi:nuclear transport factor 2 family protein [Vibrio tapetis subsp. quintayensis]|uniref:nuclear transport factor 2 family protein n=1 Tax=Vibrio tapetis TaxID=52443 RepID=UPI0025B2A737|nr:nuclear transport factor 2 family protein [Vibrio tapetis]MDN3681912.1 nuclear transport factor 2 family protein [Vibrio tapetis subsp. quintayensis]
MSEALRKACLAFSNGEVDELLPYLSEQVEWRNVGKEVIHGIDSVRAICYQLGFEPISLQVSSHFSGEEHMLVQGHGDAERAFNFCDVFQFENDQVTVITSYLVIQEENKT